LTGRPVEPNGASEGVLTEQRILRCAARDPGQDEHGQTDDSEQQPEEHQKRYALGLALG
jgi:hypothetical protein